MTDSDTPKRPRGLARSIDALFSEKGSASDDVVWEEVEEQEVEVGAPDPQAFGRALDAFLESPPLDRDGLARELRAQAVALREAGESETLADAVERLALASGDPPDQAVVAMARQLHTDSVVSLILGRLGTAKDEERRAELVRVAAVVGPDMAEPLSTALADTDDRFARRSYVEAMVALGEDAMPVLEEMLEDDRWFVVRNAVAVLGEGGGERALELITTTLAHPDERVRREALLALAKVGGEDAGMLVRGMIDDPEPEVRQAAAMAAGELKVERSLRPLLSLLESEKDDGVVAAVVRALGQLGDPGAVNAIEKRASGSLFSKPPAEVRIAAYRALHRIGTPRAMEIARGATDDKDPEVRTAVRRLLAERDRS